MDYWTIVEIVYITDVILFGYLSFHFWNALKGASDEAKLVIKTMAILATVLFFQEIYFGINTAADPNKLAAIPSSYFPFISSFWIYAKIILTFAAGAIIYTLKKLG